MVGETTGHRPGGAHHVAAVAASQRLGGVERETVAERHEGVLELGPGGRVSVYVAGCDAPDAEPPSLRGEDPVTCSVVAGIRTLQLGVEALRAAPVEPRPQRLPASSPPPHPATPPARQADWGPR